MTVAYQDHEPAADCAVPTRVAAVAHRSYDDLRVAHIRSGRIPVSTAPEGNSGRWPFLVLCVFSGSARVHHGREEAIVSAGSLVVLGASRAVHITISRHSDAVVMYLPAEPSRPYAKSFSASENVPLRVDRGGASLFAHVLRGLVHQMADYEPANPGSLARHLVGLLAVSCSDEHAGDSGQNMILQNAMDFIERHLSEVDLTPDRIAEAQNVSTRTLHRLFERDGLTVSGWTRARRLENCRIDLLDDEKASLTVSSIGARWGLHDAAHFSRLFKLSYGVSPRAYRSMSGGPRPQLVSSDGNPVSADRRYVL